MSTPYTDIAIDQIEAISDDDLHTAVLEICEEILDGAVRPALRLHALTTAEGIVFVARVEGYTPWNVFWSNREHGLRIEAVMTYPLR